MSKYIKELSNEDFDTAIKNSLRFKSCPHCGSGVNIVLRLPLYGADGVKVACTHCGYSTKLHNIHETIGNKKRFGTPITAESLSKGIFKAAEEWNAMNTKAVMTYEQHEQLATNSGHSARG